MPSDDENVLAGEEEEEEDLEDDVEDEGKSNPVDEAAEEAGSDADSSEEEEEEVNEYEQDGFVVDDVAEEEGSDEDRPKKKKKKKKRKKSPGVEIVEEEYDLLDEGPVARPEARKPKRLKKAGDDRSGKAREMKTLFGDDLDLEDELEGEEGEEGEDLRRDEVEDDYVYGSDDELDDFIVEGEDGEGPRRRRRRKGTGMFDGFSEQARQELDEIFGAPEEMLAKYEEQKLRRQREAAGQSLQGDGLEEGGEGGLEGEEEEEEPEADSEEHEQWLQRRRAAQVRKALARLDPELAERHHLRPEDAAVVATDLPERLQEIGELYRLGMDEEAAAEWIYNRLFAKAAPRRLEKVLVQEGRLEVSSNPPDMDACPAGTIRGAQGAINMFGHRGVKEGRSEEAISTWQGDDAQQGQLKEAIKNLLLEVFKNGSEVPFAAMHRKDLMGELLCMRAEDEPEVTKPEHATSQYPAGTVKPEGRRIRRWEVLWAVFEAAIVYLRLQQSKQRRRQQYEDALERAADNAVVSDAVQQCLVLLEEATTEEGVRDVEARYSLVIEAGGGDVAAAGRRPSRSTPYRSLLALGLGDLVQQMALPASAFGENVEAGYKRHEPKDPKFLPEEVASSFVIDSGGATSTMGTPAGVLKAALTMAAIEIAADANVRQGVRELYYEQARVSTNPTPSEEDMDPMSDYGPVKRLRDKPLTAFEGSSQYLLLDTASTKGLITSTLTVPEEAFESKFMQVLRELYVSDNRAPVSVEWNKLRDRVLREAFLDHLFPRLEREARARLKSDARDAALRDAAATLWGLATRCPLRVYDASLMRRIEGARVMAVVWGSGEEHPTAAVFLDQHGTLQDMLPLPQLSGGRRRGGGPGVGPRLDVFSHPKKEEDARKIIELMMSCRTTHIVMGCSSPQCTELREDLQDCINHMLMDEASHLVSLEAGSIDLVTASEQVARLWQDCSAATEELLEYPTHIRRAIGLGRYHLEPLSVLAALAANRLDILSLPLHPLQQELPRDLLWREVERTLITATCQVGVDINRAVMFPWLAHTLQYAAGLGARKAAALLRDASAHEGGFEDRVDVRSHTFLRPQRVVFRNASPFLRIREVLLANERPQESDNMLDDSRIPPDAYKKVALPLVRAAADPSRVDDEENDIYKLAKHVMSDRTEALQALDLGTLAMDAEMGAHINQMVDVRMELLAPCGELRATPLPLNTRDLFLLMHGESLESLARGKRVDARVARVAREHVRCVLQPSNAEAVILRENVKTGGWGGRLDDIMRPQQVQVCRVVEVNNDERAQLAESNARTQQFDAPNAPMDTRMVVYLSCTREYLDAEKWEREVLAHADPYYHPLTEDEKRERAEADASKKRAANRAQARVAVTRNIKHPLFKNWTMMEATKQLEENPELQCVIRPANRSTTSLSLTLRLDTHPVGSGDYSFVHVEVKEAPREGGGGGASRLGLSTPLSVLIPGQSEPESYEDLDEVYASYVEPYLAHIDDVRTHRKFVDGPPATLEAKLASDRRMTSVAANALLYYLGFYNTKPGMCIISFSCSASAARPFKEYFCPTPKGFYFRRRVFPTLEHMLAAFKRDPTFAIQKGPNPSLAHGGYSHPAAAAQQQYAGYQQPAGYAYQQPGYPAQGAYPGYPPQGAYPAQPGYPQAPPVGYAPAAGYPPAAGGYAQPGAGAAPGAYSAAPGAMGHYGQSVPAPGR